MDTRECGGERSLFRRRSLRRHLFALSYSNGVVGTWDPKGKQERVQSRKDTKRRRGRKVSFPLFSPAGRSPAKMVVNGQKKDGEGRKKLLRRWVVVVVVVRRPTHPRPQSEKKPLTLTAHSITTFPRKKHKKSLSLFLGQFVSPASLYPFPTLSSISHFPHSHFS